MLEVCDSSLLQRFLPVGGVGRVAYQSFLVRVYSLSFPLWFGLVGIYTVPYLLGISLPFHLVYIAVFGVAFLYSGSWWFLIIVEDPHCGWGWTGSLSRFPG